MGDVEKMESASIGVAAVLQSAVGLSPSMVLRVEQADKDGGAQRLKYDELTGFWHRFLSLPRS
jgi:hypothetical protein